VTNIGDGYNTHRGSFTARVPGVYLFSVTAMSIRHQVIDVAIVKTGAELCRAYGEERYDSGSCVATVHLAAGEDVWISHESGDGIHQGYSTFSGILITADRRDI
jgi:hypothetical protein